jgi:quinoprotein glucose dehydrogenase
MQEVTRLAQCRGMGKSMRVGKLLFLTLLMVPAGLQAQPGAAPAVPEITLFATEEQGGQVLALTTDDAGRVYAAVTGRSWGRGTVSALGDPGLTAQDRAVRSVEARERLVTGWLASGKLAPLLQDQAGFYQSEGDGPANFLTKYSESVCWLTDANHDGRAESSLVVAGSFRDPMDGPGSTLLALAGGRWLYGCAPHLWQLVDRNDDRQAEERVPLARGFGLRNDPWGGDLHALLEAPDGWVYFAMGERGYALRQADGTPLRSYGSGAVFRCRPDGTGLERVASGLRNPTALAMLTDGQLIAVDEAAPGGKSRLLLILPGADYGWQAEAVTGSGEGVWFEEGMEAATVDRPAGVNQPQWPLPALTPLEGPCSALQLLADGTLLAADPQGDGKGGLVQWTVARSGISYQLKIGQDVWRGGAVMALAASPAGPVYFADWGESVDVHRRSKVRKITWPAPSGQGPDASAKTPLQTPETLIQGLPGLSIRELKSLLDHPAPRVALRARQQLEGMRFQDSMETLLQVARRGNGLSARLHGLRGAGAVARQDPVLLNELIPFLNDPEPVIRAAAATLLGEGSLTEAPPSLRRTLADEALPVRLAAAAALARLRSPGMLPDLLEAAARNTGRSPLVRGSLAHAMSRTASAAALAETALAHPAAEARLTVVHALRRLAAREAAAFLTDQDPMVAAEAARAIYDVPVWSVFPALTALLDPSPDGTRPLDEAVMRRAIAAAVYLGTSVEAQRVAQTALAPETPPALKLMALTALETWDGPALVDPIWNRPETPQPRLPGRARPAARMAAEGLLNHPDHRVAAKAKHLLASPAAASPGASARLKTVHDAKAAGPERVAALLDLISDDALSSDTAKSLTNPSGGSIPPALRAEARSLLMRRDPKAGAFLTREALASGSTSEKQAAIRTLDHLPGNGGESEKLILELTRKLAAGTLEPGVQVEVVEALQRRDTASRSVWRKSTEAWQASLATETDPLAAWRMTMADGDPLAGRILFESHPEADCLSCHAIGGTGGLNGPDLDGVAGRLTAGGLLESLIHPGAKLAPGYGQPKAPAEGPADATESGSAMPPMGAVLTLRELRDLIAYLLTLKDP